MRFRFGFESRDGSKKARHPGMPTPARGCWCITAQPEVTQMWYKNRVGKSDSAMSANPFSVTLAGRLLFNSLSSGASVGAWRAAYPNMWGALQWEERGHHFADHNGVALLRLFIEEYLHSLKPKSPRPHPLFT